MLSVKSRPVGQYALCVLLILGGSVCLAITSGSNLDVAVSLASTMGGKVFYGAGALVVDIVGVALFACVVGYLFRTQQYLSGTAMAAIVGCFMAFSMVTFYGFGVKERIAKTEFAQKTHDAEVSAEAATLARKDAVRTRLLDDLQAETENVGSLLISKQANINREVAKAAIHESRNKKAELAYANIEVKAAPIYLEPDPMAKAIAEDTGFSVASVQKILTLGLGVLLILAKALAFGFGFGLWPKMDEQAAELEAEMEPDNDEQPYQLADPVPEPRAIIHSPKIAVDPIQQVEQFFEEATAPTPHGKPITATNLHIYYENWAATKNYWPVLNLNGFGRAASHLIKGRKIDMQRKPGAFGVNYFGRTPVNYSAHTRAA